MNQEIDQLSIQEFIKFNKYNINNIYINKFWIYIDDELIEWIGYPSA